MRQEARLLAAWLILIAATLAVTAPSLTTPVQHSKGQTQSLTVFGGINQVFSLSTLVPDRLLSLPTSLSVSLTTFRAGMKRSGVEMGSRPPSCRRKCEGCVPCAAVPTSAGPVHLQYANYEPEGWKCQCGPSFDNP